MEADEVVAMVRFANQVRILPKAERKARIQQWEKRLGDSDASGSDALQLALLLGSSGGATPVDIARARKLLKTYLADATDESEALLDFARYQMGLLYELERWIKAARQERRGKMELKKKLEALKAIERGMTDKDSKAKVPIR